MLSKATRTAGAEAIVGSAFSDVPRAGEWANVVLADGNIGIGGHPKRLLDRASQLLAPGGRVLVELGGPGVATRQTRLRLQDAGGQLSHWFGWAHAGVDDAQTLAAGSKLQLIEVWHEAGRWFVSLASL